MEITPLIPAGRQVIDGYGRGTFRVSGALYQGSLIVFPYRCLAWSVGSLDAVTLDSLGPVTSETPPPEILLLGTGARHEFLPRSLRDALKLVGVHIETMDTGAACRTYNVLLSEERRIAAALIAIP